MDPTPRRDNGDQWRIIFAVILLLLSSLVADWLNAPTWVDVVLIVAVVVLLPFVIRSVIRDARDDGPR